MKFSTKAIAILMGLYAVEVFPLTAQDASPRTFTVRDPRPLSAVAEILEHKYGVVINYEDAAVSASQDLEDNAALVAPRYAAAHPGFKRMAVRYSSLTVSFNADGTASDSILARAVAAHNANHNPGFYKVLQQGTAFTIVPERVLDGKGKLVSTRSPMDALISFPPENRTGWDAFELIVAQMAARGEKVEVGLAPFGYLMNTTCRIDANEEPARNVLARLLSSVQWTSELVRRSVPQRKLAWQLLYDAAEANPVYALNLHVVMIERPNPAGISSVPDLVPVE